jgi:integrase
MTSPDTDPPDPAQLEALYAADGWDATTLGVPALRGRRHVSFTGIVQPWLREATKQWCRWRLVTGLSFGTITVSADTIRRFSAFLAARQPGALPEDMTRNCLEAYQSWLLATGLSAKTRSHSLIFLRSFLEHNRRFAWLPDIPVDAAIYQDDLPRRDKPQPRFVSEYVMAQLENEANLALLDPVTRYLFIVITETGLRAGDATTLPFNPIVDDSVGWPCLRYYAHKIRSELLVPLSERAAATITAQQDQVEARWPDGSPWLFPAMWHNPDGTLPFGYWTFRRRVARWQTEIGLHDQTGRPVRVTAHQLRHTLGTRLINSGVPQVIVQRLLGHASPGMTDIYAHLHDATIREAWDRYQQTRVDINGQTIDYNPQAPTATAEWIKHNLATIRASLPNGYCGRPPQQECPHPNACLVCPDFQTTVEFLPIHRRQADNNRILIAQAEAAGRQRLAANHRHCQQNLDHIIAALEALQNDSEA